MFEKRLRTYRAIGYGRGESPLRYGELGRSPTLEAEQDSLRLFDGGVCFHPRQGEVALQRVDLGVAKHL